MRGGDVVGCNPSNLIPCFLSKTSAAVSCSLLRALCGSCWCEGRGGVGARVEGVLVWMRGGVGVVQSKRTACAYRLADVYVLNTNDKTFECRVEQIQQLQYLVF